MGLSRATCLLNLYPIIEQVEDKGAPMREIWKHIPNCHKYDVSNFGRVKGPKGILKPTVSNWGYDRIRIIDNTGEKKSFRVHRLVAQAFIPNPDNKPEVNHLDGDKQNNAMWNLEWATAAENKNHSIWHLRVSPWGRRPKMIECVETGVVYQSVAYAAKTTGVSSTSIFEHLRGNRTHAGGFHWREIKG